MAHSQQYLEVILKNHDIISRDMLDLGQIETLLHEITLKTKEPVYIK
jgi:hypothetical protein